MISYKIASIQDRIVDGKVFAVVNVIIETTEVRSTSFTFELELDGTEFSKELIENKIKEKIKFIKAVEQIKDSKKVELDNLKKLINIKGTIQCQL